MKKNEVSIGFRGTPEYREMLRNEALKRHTSIQNLCHEALDRYLDASAAGDEFREQLERALIRAVRSILREHLDGAKP